MSALPTAAVRRVVATALGLALLGVGASRCGDDRQSGDRAPGEQAATAPTPAASPGQARYLTGVQMSRPTQLRLLIPHWFLDVDTGANVRVGVTGWLPRPGGEPLLVEEVRGPDEFGQIQVVSRPEPRLPEAPRVVRLTGPALATVAASRDGGGLWVAEYHDRTRCTLREVDFAGADRSRPRQVACGTKPIGETAHGLWVDVGPDAFVEATVGSGPQDHSAVLLDPATLAERLRVPRVDLVDDHRVVVFPNPPYEAMELRDLRTGQVTPLARPTSAGYATVWPPSPDGRYLPISFDTPNYAQQIEDVWLLDLHSMAWLQLPSMPAYTSLKRTSLSWAEDGRLVLLGEFYESGQLLVTWRPGDAALALLAYQRPAIPPDQPGDDRFLVLPPSGRSGG